MASEVTPSLASTLPGVNGLLAYLPLSAQRSELREREEEIRRETEDDEWEAGNGRSDGEGEGGKGKEEGA